MTVFLVVEQGREEDDPNETYEVILGYCTYDFDAKAYVATLTKEMSDEDRKRGIWYGFRPCQKLR